MKLVELKLRLKEVAVEREKGVGDGIYIAPEDEPRSTISIDFFGNSLVGSKKIATLTISSKGGIAGMAGMLARWTKDQTSCSAPAPRVGRWAVPSVPALCRGNAETRRVGDRHNAVDLCGP